MAEASALFGRAPTDASGSHSRGSRGGPTVSLPDAESRRQLLPRGRSNNGGDHSVLSSSSRSHAPLLPIEEFVAKYQVIKVSWRGKYERILALAPTRFCTIDPRDFEVTNTWPLSALLSISLDASDSQGFMLALKGPKKDEQLKLRCRFRSRLLSDLYRLREQNQQRKTGAGFQCSKWSRKGETLSCSLDVGMDGVTIAQEGAVRSKYLYTEMEHVTLLADSQVAFVIGYTGRSRLFFSQQRGQIYQRIQAAAEAIGCKIKARASVTAEKIQEERGYYGLNYGEPFVQFHVRKLTPKCNDPQERILSLHEKALVELDREEKVVACYSYADIYVLVREATSADQFDIQFRNDQVRTYESKDRDGVLSAIYDICVTCEENPELFISGVVNQRGLRLLPFSAVEDATETQSFFNDSSIGNWYLQRMSSLGKFGNSLKVGDRGFVEIVAEFNANVPASGIPYNTKHSIIADALRPMCAQLYYVAKTKPVSERAAVTLIQALFRISSSYYGFREIGQAGQISETITNLLINGEEFVVFWTTLLLRKLTAHVAPKSTALDKAALRYCEEVETHNKKVFLANTYLTQSLITHLEDIDVEPGSKNTSQKPRAGPLVMMGLLQTLEGCLCSRASTTGPEEFMTLVEGVAKFYSTLLKVLFQSRCATTVEACTLLLKTTLEECDPVVASSIRDKALTEGIVLRHLYQGLFDESFDQRCVSRYLVSLWMSHHDGSKQLLSRMIPPGFFFMLNEPPGTPAQIEDYDHLEREAMEAERQENALEFNDDDYVSSTSESTFQGGSIDWQSGGETSSFAGSDIPPEKISQKSMSTGDIGLRNGQGGLQAESRRLLVSNLPIPENRSSFSGERPSLTWSGNGRSSFETPIENGQSKARMLRKLKSSVDGSSASKRSANNSARENNSRSSSHDRAPRLRKRDVALSFLGALGGKKSPSHNGHRSSRGKHHAMSRSTRAQENFRLLFHMLSLDHETVDMIWNKRTREELRQALYTELKRFTRFQINIGGMKARWNYEDFGVSYPSLADEVVVGGCYIRILANLQSKMSFFGTITEEDDFTMLTPEQVPVRNPAAVLAALYVRMLRENIHAEFRDDLETSVLCIKSMGVVAAAHAGFVNAVNFDEVGHLWTLMSETVHASMLENFLHTVRALCLHPGNARRVLSDEHNLELAVQLLQLAHATNREFGDITEPKKLWILETTEGEQLGPFSVNELKQKRDEEHTDMSSFLVARQDDPACETVTTKAKVMEIAQLRWEVGILGGLHPLQMAHDAASVLLSVAHSNSLLGGNSTHGGDFASPIFPPPRGKTTLWKYARQVLPVLVRGNHPKLWEKVAMLLDFLYTDRQPIGGSIEEDATNRSSLFSWGLFYLAFISEKSDFKAMAGLLKSTHHLQAGFNGTSALKGILPQDMISLLERSSPSAFTKVFCEGEQSPLVFWSPEMRNHLQTLCQAHLQDFAEVLEEDTSRKWSFCPMAPVAFKELAAEVWCGGVYLGQFCEHENFAVSDPLDFMDNLTMAWRVEVSRQDASIDAAQARQILGVTEEADIQNLDATLRAGFKEKARALVQSNISAAEYSERLDELREAYRVLTCPRPTLLSAGHDPENLLLLLHSLVIMCNRYPEELANYEFDAYDLLLPLLAAHCTADGTLPEGTTTAQALEISVCAAELVYNTCAVSVANGELLLEQPDLDTLEKAVNYCVDSMVGCEAAANPELLEVCFVLLQTITGLLASSRGREWIAESSTLLVDMVRILWLWNHAGEKSFLLSKLTQQVLEGISRMTQLSKNQDRLVRAGVLWQLFMMFSTYDVELDDSTINTRLHQSLGSEEEEFAVVAFEVQNLLAIMAVRALCRVGGLFAEGSEFQSPCHRLVRHVVDSLMTPNLSELLLLSSHHEFLKIFHGECESYTLFWNGDMRHELTTFVSPRAGIEPTVSTDEHYVDAIKFRFMYLADTFYVGGLYIEMLMGSLLVIEKSLVPAPVAELGLTEKFFKESFSFIDNGELVCPEYVDDEGNVEKLPPYAGWNVGEEQLTTMGRVTALNCLSITTSVAPALVEKNLVANDSAMKMILRLLFPPDNEVHQSEDAEKSLVLTPQLYVPCRLHCLATLQVVSTLEGFGAASLEFGICDILIELVHICPDVGPEALGIIRNLCAGGAAGHCVSEILQSGVYLEFIGWVLLVEETIVDDEFDAAERLRVPAAMVLSEMVKDGAPLNIESRRTLCRFFPPAIVRAIASSPDTIVEYIMADHKTPELVWNVEFRNHQRNCIVNFLNIYFSSTSTTETDDGNFTSMVDSFEVDYTGLFPAPMAGNVYLTLFMEDPTFNLHDPLYFMTCLWSEFEVLFRQLAHMTSALRATMSRADDELIQRDIDLVDLVGSALVCLLQVETSLLGKVAELQISAQCCGYLNDTVRSQACEPCVVNVVRILRVCTISRTCIESMQPMCSTALSCLMAVVNPARGGPLHYESAFVLEMMRRIILQYPERVKDLGKNLAKYVIVFNCSDGLDYKSVGRMFAGLVQSGGWGCFDEFNRIEIEVLSVVAQQVLTIMQALTARQTQVMFLGSMMRVNFNMGIFITMNPGYAGRTELPDNLKALMRPCAMMVPDLALIAEVMLQAEGFRDAKVLAKKTTTLYGLMIQQLSKQDHYDFGLRSLKAVLNMAGTLKREDPNLQEENILLRALRDMNMPKFIRDDAVLFRLLLGDLFPSIELPVTDYGKLQGNIEQALLEHKLQVHPVIVFKTIQLYESQVTRHCNMIVGQTMAGKTTIWKTLMAAKTSLAKEGVPGYMPVRVQVLNPKSISLNEIYGVYDLSTFEWIDGILSAIFRNLAADEKAEEKWIMLDGPVDTLWIESMNSVMDDNKVLTLINGDRISMSPSMALMFEVQDLAVASPATVSRAGMVYMDVEDLGWRPFIQTWLTTTINVQEERDVLQALFEKYMEKVLRFKTSEVTELIPVTTFNSVNSFCNLYNALATVENGVDLVTCGDKFAVAVEKWFLFCMTWSVMAAANEEGRKKFDFFLRDIDSVYPPLKTAYDFFVEPSSREFKLWDEKLPPNFRIAPNTPFHKIMVPTIDTLRYGFLLQTMLASGIHTLLVGETGVGKTTVIEREIEALSDAYNVLVMNFSSATSSATTQDMIENVMEKRSLNRFGPVGGKKLVTFIDDMNMPTKDLFGSQPPLELLRQWVDYSCWYDRKKQTLKYFIDMQFVAAMGPPGGGRSVISSRFQSRFNLINMTIPEQAQLKRIFETMLVPKLSEFDDEIKPLGVPLVAATIQLYQNVLEQFLPTPANCHYLFNLRDMARVIQGLLLSDKHNVASRDGMLRLWMHESLRVFSDRLTSYEDRQTFKKKLDDLLGVHFQTDWGRLLSSAPEQLKENGPLFTYIFSTTPGADEGSARYAEVMDMKMLKGFVEEQLENHNAEPGFVPMNLVMFSDALMHILRIHRQLMTMRGNLLLVGVGGSGRQSLTKLAAFMGGFKVFQIEVGKNYRSFEFHEDIKKLYTQVGLQQQKTVFLFSDTQIKSESFVEDLNNILSSGEIPGLFEKDEQAGIIDGVRLRARAQGVRETKESLWNFFISEVRRNLHVVLAFSPIGKGFCNRCRQFPSLVNNTNIDWFNEWPLDALQEVGMKFLEEKNVASEPQRPKIAAVFAVVHSSVMLASSQVLARMKRHNYVTPTNYLSLVTGYVELLSEKAATIRDTRDKLKNGLAKLEESRLQVEEMSKQLEQRKIVVAQKNKDCSDLLVVIVSERRVADEQRKQVEADSERIAKEEAETKKIADDAQKDLDEALPALQRAMQEVENLDKKAIAEVKVYTQPPEAVSMVMCAVMILFGLPPTWASAKTKMNDVSFLQQIKTFDKDSIRDKTVTALKKYTSKPAFNADMVRKVSSAAGALCSWVLAMECYSGVFRVVAPKKEVLRKSQQALAVKQKDLQVAKEKLQEVTEKVEALKNQYDTSVSEKNALREEAELLELKLSRAEQLVKGLAGERERWEGSIADKNASLQNVVGDALVAAAFISYAGPFDTFYRGSLVDTWMNRVTQQALPLSPKFTFIDFLADPTDVRSWNAHGLPRDPLSTENGVITTRGKRWPLMIDPQGQANKWIKAMEGSRLEVVDPMMKDLLRKLENGIRFGSPVLMQDILEELDPSLEPVLTKSIIKVGNREVLRLGDKELDYNREFRFYLTTKLHNPHYTPEVSTKTTIVNFVVKEQGLEAQLLGIAVQLEEPALEEQKSDLVMRVAAAKKKLIDLENEILRLLSAAKGSLLDDEQLVTTLNASKTTSEEVSMQLVISEETEKKIDAARMGYARVALRSSTLYFVLNDMTSVDPMYQFSLDAYVALFQDSIVKSRSLKNQGALSEELTERINAINDYHTYAVYAYACRGLFERHKLLFSLQMCARVLQSVNKLPHDEYDFLLKGGNVLAQEEKVTNVASEFLSDGAWAGIVELNKLPAFHGIISSFEQTLKGWKSWYQSSTPEIEALPGDWEGKCNELQRMLLLRCIRPDRLSIQAARFTATHLGAQFVDPPPFDLKAIYETSNYKTPLIFVLSPGVDPTNSLIALAESLHKTVENCALGQGQASVAEAMLSRGLDAGNWVFLANCHLMLSWAPTLEKLIDNFCAAAPAPAGPINPQFRLWLTSSPNPKFPIAILQRGIKMTTEPPRGLKANLIRLYNTIMPDKFARCRQVKKYKRLLFCLCWFHSLLLERRKFNNLGWNIPYDFNESDFAISEDVLAIYLDEYEDTPWDALKYLIAQANYGGRVTDDWDRRLMLVYISQFFSENVLTVDNMPLSDSEYYFVPDDGELTSYVEYIRQLPLDDPPAAFGQHPNAQIASQIDDGRELLATILSLQALDVAEGGSGNDDTVLGLLQTLRETVPDVFDLANIKAGLSARSDPDALKTVLMQELERYNKLLATINSSARALEKGIQGSVVITPELEAVYNALLIGAVPKAWSFCYPSLKPLGPWTQDLKLRCEQMDRWANQMQPPVFWLTGFTYPTGFLTALLQTAARKNGLAIDSLNWEFIVLNQGENALPTGPKDGAYIKGLILEGARWDFDHDCLAEPNPMELHCGMPILHFRPVEAKKKSAKGLYSCPLYMYPLRTGTRERPSFMIAVDLKVGPGKTPDLWTRRGTALLLSLST